MTEEAYSPTPMQMQVSLPRKVLVTAAVMFVLILLAVYFNIPNPNMILIMGLVFCSALFGFGGGIVAAVIMCGYTLYFFSTGHSFVEFTPENLQKVAVSMIGIAADMLLVCLLKRTEVQAFSEIRSLTGKLHKENELLHSISLTDALTGIRNRMALKRDLDSYLNREVNVMMIDLDDFKQINDSQGHEEGDRVLRETGKLLADTFGEDHCYRYGGDEFLIIFPDVSEEEFLRKVDALMKDRPFLRPDGEKVRVSFSVGCVHAAVDEADRLGNLISNADERMYQSKRDRRHSLAAEGFMSGGFITEDPEGQKKAEEYSVSEMNGFLKKMSSRFDLARLVDPIECRVLYTHEDGKISVNESCYGIWNADQKCINCSSAVACRTGCCQRKNERFHDQVFHIQSKPVKLRLEDGGIYEAVVELVSIEKEAAAGSAPANNRAAENSGHRASHYRAFHDSLTKVLNADAFYELARERILKNQELSWVLVTGNIMDFRLVNTLFGVTRGNEVLVRTAGRLRMISEDAGGLCGRLGGDHFALLLPQESYREEALTDAARSLSEEFNSGIYTFCIHFGVYRTDESSLPVSVMCGRANSALRTIRQSLTKSVAYFDDTLLEKSIFAQQVISGFEKALKDGQFRMYLQPLVGENGSVIGAEALVRWIRPDGSMIMPGDFIETLEQAGLIHELDMYLWELAVKQLSLWKETEKKDLTISVNMSAKDFYSIDVYKVLTGLVDRYGVDSSCLRLEITETALLVDPGKSNAVVSQLRDRGFLVEIDDFGKGYSSLSLLKNIQADVLKIDMGFLREIIDRKRSRIILESVINMAMSLDMDVITEGVETREQLDALLTMGCRHFQGYYFSRPIPVTEFEEKYVVPAAS